MMKHLVFAALGFALAGGTMAQTVSTGAFSFPTVNEGSCMSVPKIFTYNNKPLLTLRDGQDGNGGVSARINVYDENIELVKAQSQLEIAPSPKVIECDAKSMAPS